MCCKIVESKEPLKGYLYSKLIDDCCFEFKIGRAMCGGRLILIG